MQAPVEGNHEIAMPYTDRVHGRPKVRYGPMLFNAVVALCFMIFEIYSDQNPLFVEQLTG